MITVFLALNSFSCESTSIRDVPLYSLLPSLRRKLLLPYSGIKLVAADSIKTSENFYQTAQSQNIEARSVILRNHRQGNP
jgi:hypothetical protein